MKEKTALSAKIWVDADACPNVIKEILFRAAERVQIEVTLVANHVISVPKSKWVRFVQVESGFDVADDHIVQQAQKDDLVVTADIPLAAEVIEKGAFVLSPRGERYTTANIKARLTMRDFMEQMRSSGEQIKGPDAMTQADRQAFANQLDRWLTSLSA